LTDAGRAFLDNARALLQTRMKPSRKRRALPAQSLPNSTSATHHANCEIPAENVTGIFRRRWPNVHVRLHDWSKQRILEGTTTMAAQLD